MLYSIRWSSDVDGDIIGFAKNLSEAKDMARKAAPELVPEDLIQVFATDMDGNEGTTAVAEWLAEELM